MADVVALCILCGAVGVLGGVLVGQSDPAPAHPVTLTFRSTVRETQTVISTNPQATITVAQPLPPHTIVITSTRTLVLPPRTVTLPPTTVTVTSVSGSSGPSTSNGPR